MNSIRKNDFVELKETFIDFIYYLPKEEARQCQYLHKVMLRVQFMLQDTYGMNEDMKNQFANYYSNLNHLPAVKAVDVCYKILCRAIELRQEEAGKMKRVILKNIWQKLSLISKNIFKRKTCQSLQQQLMYI